MGPTSTPIPPARLSTRVSTALACASVAAAHSSLGRNRRLVELWHLARATSALPLPGGLLAQDPFLLRAFALLADVDRHVAEGKEKAFAQLGALGALFR